MSFSVFELPGVLGAALTPTTNPMPSALATQSPYDGASNHTHATSAGWATQNRRGLFPTLAGGGQMPIGLSLIPSGGATTTYTLTLWKWDGSTWVKAAGTSTRSYVGPCLEYIENPGKNPWFIQINSISSGTLTIRFNTVAATAL
jgi:hypothetical protein